MCTATPHGLKEVRETHGVCLVDKYRFDCCWNIDCHNNLTIDGGARITNSWSQLWSAIFSWSRCLGQKLQLDTSLSRENLCRCLAALKLVKVCCPHAGPTLTRGFEFIARTADLNPASQNE
eukprot:2983494-Amphidinium_carterae.1